YIDKRPNGDALRKCILEGPYQPTIVTIPAVPATENSPTVPERTIVEIILTMSPENKAHYESKKEAIHLLLTGIGDEIYSTVDACKTAHEMWIAIERLQQGKSLNIQDVKTNLFWEFGKFISHDGESMESFYIKFYKMMNEMIRNNLTVATMQVNLFDILKQYQKEDNEIYAERIAKNANPLALVDAAQQYPDPYYQAPKSHKLFVPPSKQASSTKSNASTKFKGKEIAKPITAPSESASEEDSDPEQAQRDKDMQKNLALIAKYFKKIYKPTNNNLRTSSNSRNKNVDTTPRYKNDNQTGQFGNQRTVDVVGDKETIGNTDDEIDEKEWEAHYSFMAKIQEDRFDVVDLKVLKNCFPELVLDHVAQVSSKIGRMRVQKYKPPSALLRLKWMIIFDLCDQFDHFDHIGQEGKGIAGLAGAEKGSFIVISFKVSALNVDFDFKINLIVFCPETGSTRVSFSSGGKGCYRLKIHQLNHNQLLKSQRQQLGDNLDLLLSVIDTSELSAEDFTNIGSFSLELEVSSVS
ncbi:hypothetical protein Tco_0870526, partial [Tanacetum coccineum]